MKLASVEKIISLTPIEGADKVELATVLGWKVVVKKGEFREGDLACYIQIDTIVPEKPEFEFLRERKFRVRSIKLRKQLSQGLLIPIELKGKWEEGDDITEVLGVKKYEKSDNNPSYTKKPRVPKVWYKKWLYLFKYKVLYKLFPKLQKVDKSPFPSHLVPKTDETRIQNIPQILQKYAGEKFVLSYKLDGSSITIIHSKVKGKSNYRICSRNWELHDTNNEWHKVFNSTYFHEHIDNLVKYYNTNDIIVQGEAIGKFNGNHHNLKNNEIRLFNIFVNGKQLTQCLFIDVCELLEIPYCPIYKDKELNFTMSEILQFSEIKDCFNPKVEAEGLVWRHYDKPISFKVINNKYLLKKGE